MSHSKTRWLSLYPIIKRTLEMYQPLKSYFLSIDRPPIVLKTFFENPISEAYLTFVYSLAHSFHSNILKMEKQSNSVVETLSILKEVSELLKVRIETKFLPINVISILNKNSDLNNECKKFKEEYINVYISALEYLSKWTKQFSPFKVFEWMSLTKVPEWNEIINTILHLKEREIQIDDVKCLNQFVNLKKFLELEEILLNQESISINDKCMRYFNSINNLEKCSEFILMCQYMFAIPAHNATVERIFSLIEAQWTDERNRMGVDTVANLIMIKFNFHGQSCIDFYKNILKNEDVLKSVGKMKNMILTL